MLEETSIQFLGAATTVTGSKFLVRALGKNILIDCGMFQGTKELSELNRLDLSIAATTVDLVLITHGHLDHVGYLPRLVQQGYTNKIIGSAPTLAIAEIILLDSGKINEEMNDNEEVIYDPLYTLADAERTIQLFEAVKEDQWIRFTSNISYRFKRNGHIIGATFIELKIKDKTLVFSGDIGRTNDLLLDCPEKPKWADYLVVESTYGHKLHSNEDIEAILSELIQTTILNRGNLIIPSFAIERLQLLMYILWKLYQKNRIPNIPVFIDSPMGNNVLEVFKHFIKWHNLTDVDFNAMCNHFTIIESYRDTWNTIDDPRPKVVIAGSGMVTGGRVLTYLKQLIDQKTTTVLLVGYQAEGTRGRQLQDGVQEIEIFGKNHDVNATIVSIESLSAHADQAELLDWLSEITNIPEAVYLVHGEQKGLQSLRLKIEEKYGWKVTIPCTNDTVKFYV